MTTEPTRERVADILRVCEPGCLRGATPIEPEEMAALCRAWLALHDVPVGEVDGKTVRLVAVDYVE